MIRRVRGELLAVEAESALVDVAGLAYEVLLPPPLRDRLAERGLGSTVELYTYHYLQSDGNRVTPYLLGFETELQREFFERLLDVPRLGPLSALRALILPVGEIAWVERETSHHISRREGSARRQEIFAVRGTSGGHSIMSRKRTWRTPRTCR